MKSDIIMMTTAEVDKHNAEIDELNIEIRKLKNDIYSTIEQNRELSKRVKELHVYSIVLEPKDIEIVDLSIQIDDNLHLPKNALVREVVMTSADSDLTFTFQTEINKYIKLVDELKAEIKTLKS